MLLVIVEQSNLTLASHNTVLNIRGFNYGYVTYRSVTILGSIIFFISVFFLELLINQF